MEKILKDAKILYSNLRAKQMTEVLKQKDREELESLRDKLYTKINPQLEDLDNYYKFRVIVDFISGMTDKFALNHFQKISGQKIG